MTTLREAAMLALEAWDNDENGTMDHPLSGAMEALRAALEQPEQEPVAWLKTMYSGTRPMLEVDHLRKDTSTPVFTHPPRREWRGLTEEEIDAVWEDAQVFNTHYDIARAIEAALKEKNHE